MKRIETLTELKAEKVRLHQKKLFLENEIENNFRALKESFAPLQLVTDGATKMLVNKNNGISRDLISMVSDFIFKKVVLRNSGFMLRLVLPLIARNTANNLLTENKTKILGWIGDLVLKFGRRKDSKQIFDKATADIDY